MNEMPSAEFRRVYSKLTEPTLVTVNGHPIGTWEPGDPAVRDARAFAEARAITLALDPDFDKRFPAPTMTFKRPFAEFRPAPKPSRRQR